jgi:hypothetical protein
VKPPDFIGGENKFLAKNKRDPFYDLSLPVNSKILQIMRYFNDENWWY